MILYSEHYLATPPLKKSLDFSYFVPAALRTSAQALIAKEKEEKVFL